MDIEKMRKWLEITNEYRNSDFWSSVLKQKHPDEFFKEKMPNPIFDMYQNENYNFIIFEIPGVNQEDLSLNLISNTHLKISGKINPVLPLEMEMKRERVYGEFERVIELPEATQAHLMHIQVNNGLLHISYPRKVESISFP
ncbi:Hsp20/alpha crystallin family protein [Cytobacillus dafuensis]|uniref:Hsp20/alpha crystallin family protein n=1 Tax=Cytobacillus dafuensis TaxID=1742359 RepID=A0A5B8Z0B6_CYTDA|nr:Hsp20/alpha crystallin family protein [Cytobacillus dafuensis]QED46191.1 Hsp20/alpha crystallin family protein [Cytobacillus dafuensis]